MTALPPPPLRLNAFQRRIASVVLDYVPVRPYPLDMTTWVPFGPIGHDVGHRGPLRPAQRLRPAARRGRAGRGRSIRAADPETDRPAVARALAADPARATLRSRALDRRPTIRRFPGPGPTPGRTRSRGHELARAADHAATGARSDHPDQGPTDRLPARHRARPAPPAARAPADPPVRPAACRAGHADPDQRRQPGPGDSRRPGAAGSAPGRGGHCAGPRRPGGLRRLHRSPGVLPRGVRAPRDGQPGPGLAAHPGRVAGDRARVDRRTRRPTGPASRARRPAGGTAPAPAATRAAAAGLDAAPGRGGASGHRLPRGQPLLLPQTPADPAPVVAGDSAGD